MCPEFLCGGDAAASRVGAAAAVPGSGALEYAGALLLPSPSCLLCMAVGAAAGVLLGCGGATLLRPCAAVQCLPLVVAGAALYAAAYLT